MFSLLAATLILAPEPSPNPAGPPAAGTPPPATAGPTPVQRPAAEPTSPQAPPPTQASPPTQAPPPTPATPAGDPGAVTSSGSVAAEPPAYPPAYPPTPSVVQEPEVPDDTAAAGDEAAGGAERTPFFQEAPISETAFPTKPRGLAPRLSVGEGTFCFVEDAHCKAALLLSGSVGIGIRVIGQNGPDIPFSQFTARGGFAVRPFTLAKGVWHPWTIGAVGSWSIGPSGIRVDDAELVTAEDVPTRGFRLAVLNQIWLGHKKNAMHMDITLGGVRSGVLSPSGRVVDLWGTHAEFAFGFGGWGALVASADFLDQDTRVVFGFRLHGFAAGPAAGLVAAGLAGGGKL